MLKTLAPRQHDLTTQLTDCNVHNIMYTKDAFAVLTYYASFQLSQKNRVVITPQWLLSPSTHPSSDLTSVIEDALGLHSYCTIDTYSVSLHHVGISTLAIEPSSEVTLRHTAQ